MRTDESIILVAIEEITYQAYSPMGLDLKLLKRALKGPPKIPLE